MADFNKDNAQQFQSHIIQTVRETERQLDHNVLENYTNDTVDNEADYYENLRGLHSHLKSAYRRLGDLLTEIESRQG